MKKYILITLMLSGILSASDCVNTGNNLVTCSDSGLMWQDNSEVTSNKRGWQEAIEYCENLTLGGYSDWRLPNITELNSITNFNINVREEGKILKDGFNRTSESNYWSSTTYAKDTTHAWGSMVYGVRDHTTFSGFYSHFAKVGDKYDVFVRCARTQ